MSSKTKENKIETYDNVKQQYCLQQVYKKMNL